MLLKSFAHGIVFTIIAFCLALLIGNKIVSQILLLPMTILAYRAGTPPILGYDEQGNPMYEGTPFDIFIPIFGLLLSIPYYSMISFIVFVMIDRFKKKSVKNADF